jgi:hypothetical protein
MAGSGEREVYVGSDVSTIGLTGDRAATVVTDGRNGAWGQAEGPGWTKYW